MDTFTPTGFTDKCNHENTKNTKNGTKKTTFSFSCFRVFVVPALFVPLCRRRCLRSCGRAVSAGCSRAAAVVIRMSPAPRARDADRSARGQVRLKADTAYARETGDPGQQRAEDRVVGRAFRPAVRRG